MKFKFAWFINWEIWFVYTLFDSGKLCWFLFINRYPEYHASLSRASQMTLIAQGGPMKQNEAEKFEKGDDFSALIQMRKWDEQAKYPDIPLEDNKYYIDACKSILKSSLSQ